jgi:rod shape-determining protein MreC
MAYFTADRERAGAGENMVGIIVTPLQELATSIGHSVGEFFDYFKDTKALNDENERLEVRNNELEARIREIEQYEFENKRLLELLDLKEHTADYNTIAAQVIAKDAGNWYHTFTINKGSKDGISVNMAVVTSEGLVGRVSEVGYTWAKVTSVIDTKSSISATVIRTQDIAIAKGDVILSDEGMLKLTYVNKNADLSTGDLIETSGLGGIFPSGILIGKVIEVKSDLQGVSQYAVIEPAADLLHVYEVLVLDTKE